MKFETKDLALITIFAALYAVMVLIFAPISFYALQFRFAGILRPAIAKKKLLAIGYAIGVVVANFFSPFTGFHELVFMPIMSLVAGLLGYYIARSYNSNYYVAGVVIAIIIPLSVGWMLNQLFGVPILVSLPSLLVSEQIVNFLGASILRAIDTRYKWYN